MRDFKLASLEEINGAHGIQALPELGVLAARAKSLLQIQFGLVADTIDDNTADLWSELSEKGIVDLHLLARTDLFIRGTEAIIARLEELDTLLGSTDN